MLPFIVAMSQAEPVDVLRLPIGPAREVKVGPGWTSTSSGNAVTVEDVAKAADPLSFVVFGESHDSQPHKEGVAELISALHARGREVVLGLEMFTRPNQRNLDPWTRGYWDEATFQREANWAKEWGFDYSIYRPTFEVVRKLKIPMIALNAPRDWVRAVGRGGPSALPAEAAGQFPAIDTSNREHRMVFDGLMGGHPMTGAQGENIYSAQVLWDVAMADSALKGMARWTPTPRRVMVILAGSGHALYGQGINFRLNQQAGAKSLTVIGIDGKEPRTVRVGIGDFTLMR